MKKHKMTLAQVVHDIFCYEFGGVNPHQSFMIE